MTESNVRSSRTLSRVSAPIATSVGARTIGNRVALLRALRTGVSTMWSPAGNGRLGSRRCPGAHHSACSRSCPLQLVEREVEAEQEQRQPGPEERSEEHTSELQSL